MSNKIINIAIDGPAGAGKSTIAKAAAKELGFIYVDTGALYRTVGVNALRKGINTRDSEKVAQTLDNLTIELKFENKEQKVYLFGEDVSKEIRTPAASMAASDVSAVPEVRKYLFDSQRNIAKTNSCIMDGRDIGTVVLPHADVKIFLTATPEKRAKRRYDELIQKGSNVSFEEVLSDLKERDYNDSHREVAPLKPADDSILIDTSELNLEDSIQKVISVIKEHI